jgi:type II secretory pathway component PulF
MPAFSWEAVDHSGRSRRGVQVATNPADLARILEKDGYVLLGYHDGPPSAMRDGARAPAVLLVEALRSVVALLRAGLPLERAMVTAADAADVRCGPILLDIREGIKQGSTVADGFARQPTYFDTAAIGLIRSGERSGDLAGALEMLVQLREREIQVRSSFLTSAIYPAILAGTSIVAAGAVIVVVVPRFASMIANAGGNLPATTELILSVSVGLRATLLPLTIAAVGTLFGVVSASRTDVGRHQLDRMLSRLPVLGPLRHYARMARGARVAGSLSKAGIPLVEALSGAAEALGASSEAASFRRASGLLRDGTSPSDALSGPEFPPVLSRLARAGSEVGDMATFLLAAADTLDRTTEVAIRRLGILLEPLVIVTFGGVIGFVAFALFQAVYSMNMSGVQ